MATTLTLGTTNFTLSNNTGFNSVTGLNLTDLTGDDSITIGPDPGTGISGSTGSGNDTLTVATALTGTGTTRLTTLDGNDVLRITASVQGYSLEGGAGNDNFAIASTFTGGSINGNVGADIIVIDKLAIIGTSTITLDDSGGTAADTLVLGNLTAGAFGGSTISSFDKARDTLLVGEQGGATTKVITSADWGSIATGSYTGAQLATANTAGNADIAALASFLSSNGAAKITII